MPDQQTWPVEMWLAGQEGHVPRCAICLRVAWDGKNVAHAKGCLIVAELVRGVRAGGIDFQKEARKLLAILEDDGA